MTKVDFTRSGRYLVTMALIPLILLSSGCRPQGHFVEERYMDYLGRSFPHLQGKIIQGRYFDSSGTFSIHVPNSPDLRTLDIEERVAEDGTLHMVCFKDTKIGASKRVDVFTLPDTDHLDIFREHPDACGEILQSIFQNVTLSVYMEAYPGAISKFEEIVNPESSDAAFFSVIEGPDKYQCIDLGSGKFLNWAMGTLLFYSGQQFVILAHAMPFLPDLDFSVIVDHLRDSLVEMRGSYRNELNYAPSDLSTEERT
jgi:hypothetical protein